MRNCIIGAIVIAIGIIAYFLFSPPSCKPEFDKPDIGAEYYKIRLLSMEKWHMMERMAFADSIKVLNSKIAYLDSIYKQREDIIRLNELEYQKKVEALKTAKIDYLVKRLGELLVNDTGAFVFDLRSGNVLEINLKYEEARYLLEENKLLVEQIKTVDKKVINYEDQVRVLMKELTSDSLFYEQVKDEIMDKAYWKMISYEQTIEEQGEQINQLKLQKYALMGVVVVGTLVIIFVK